MRDALLLVHGPAPAFLATLCLVDFVRKHGPVEVHVANASPVGWSAKPTEWKRRSSATI